MASGILRSGGRVQRLIVTGANGAGKSHVAARLSAERPDIPLVSFDSIKLLEGWRQRPRPDAYRARQLHHHDNPVENIAIDGIYVHMTGREFRHI